MGPRLCASSAVPAAPAALQVPALAFLPARALDPAQFCFICGSAYLGSATQLCPLRPFLPLACGLNICRKKTNKTKQTNRTASNASNPPISKEPLMKLTWQGRRCSPGRSPSRLQSSNGFLSTDLPLVHGYWRETLSSPWRGSSNTSPRATKQ